MSTDPLTSLKAMVERIDPGPRMVDASLLKQMYEIQGMHAKAAALDHGPRLVDEGDLRQLATFLNKTLLVDTFQETGERLIEGTAFKELAIAGQTPPGPTAPPANTTPPAITGTPAVGQLLTCGTGAWSNEPTSYTYQWQSEGISIGVTTPTWTVTAGEAGNMIRCMVTATNAIGSSGPVASNTVTIA